MSLPHRTQPVYSAGAKLQQASAALILLHGRGAPAEDILSLSKYLDYPQLAYLAPQAEGYTWYPNRFIFPVEQNEPYLSAALAKIDEIVRQVEANNIPVEKIFIGGFSQGACLASEYVIRNPRRYGGLLAFSGGYIGPLDTERQPNGDLQGMPAFLGCSDRDPHIPLQRVKETTALLNAMGANVTEKIYPNMGHTIIEEEIELARQVISMNL
ncbi:MAG TPA: dienelactone hydrolase family protein [Anaerolineales bacterium]|nr:dienelactone hydrolase family protein [Anaerolineales bacterium]